MAQSPSRPPSLKEQLAQRRWNRVQQMGARSKGDVTLRSDRIRLTDADFRVSQRRWLSMRTLTHPWAGRIAAVAAAALVACAAVGWVSQPSAADIKAGEQLFTHKWQPHDSLSAAGDGLGPVFNARSCVECHFQGGTGGGGGLQHNVAAFEVLPTHDLPYPTAGVIHASATQDDWKESFASVREVYPIVPKGMTITAVCKSPLREDYDPVVRHSINTPTLFGAGLIDQIPDSVIRAHHTQRTIAGVQRELKLQFKSAGTGRVRILPNGRVGKFGWKAQFATLDEFVANACAVELGLTTPTRKQHLPQKHREDPGAQPDLSSQQFVQLVSFVGHLPAPKGSLPQDEVERELVQHGRTVFTSIGCADCHTPDVGGAKGVYSDFCLHDLTDKDAAGYTETPDVPVPEDYPSGPEWKTPPLWGAAQTAPYLHDGSASTLKDAIEAHGGQGRHVRAKFRDLASTDRQALLRFLESLTTE